VHYSHQRIKFGDAVDVCVREECAQNMQRVVDVTPKMSVLQVVRSRDLLVHYSHQRFVRVLQLC